MAKFSMHELLLSIQSQNVQMNNTYTEIALNVDIKCACYLKDNFYKCANRRNTSFEKQ